MLVNGHNRKENFKNDFEITNVLLQRGAEDSLKDTDVAVVKGLLNFPVNWNFSRRGEDRSYVYLEMENTWIMTKARIL